MVSTRVLCATQIKIAAIISVRVAVLQPLSLTTTPSIALPRKHVSKDIRSEIFQLGLALELLWAHTAHEPGSFSMYLR